MTAPTSISPRLGTLLRSPSNGFLDVGLTLNWFAVVALLCGMASARVLNVVGEVYAGELLLIQSAFLLLVLGKVRPLTVFPILGVFLQMAVLMLLGYILSDIYRDAQPAQFLRGWARVILVTLDCLALAAIVAHDKRNLWWFILGMAIGGIAQLMVRGVPIMSPPGWKFGYSVPLVSLLACVSCLLPIKVAAIGFAVLGVVNIFMDFRIMGAICVVVAAILWLRDGGMTQLSGRRLLKLMAVCMAAGTILGGAMLATHDEFSKRREQSNAGRGAGLSVALWAVAESPLIGYGSWPMDARLVNFYYQEMEDAGQLSPSEPRGKTFAAHSQILQGWVEGGLLGALFWVLYGIWLIRAGWYAAMRRQVDAHLPALLFFLIYDFWHLLMSPFSAPTRLPIALGVTMICVCADEMRKSREVACDTASRS